MKKIRYLLNCILAAFLSVIICLDFAIILVRNKVITKNYLMLCMDNIKYYDLISNEISSALDNYKYQSGLPEEIFEDLYSLDTIKKDINSVIDYIYYGTPITNSSETVKSTLDSRINSYIESQNIKLNKQGQENIKVYENIIEKEYNDNINSSSLIYKPLRSTYETINSFYSKVKMYAIIISIIIFFLIILLNIKNLLYAINFIGISALTSGSAILASTVYLTSKLNIDNITLFNAGLTSLVINMFREISFLVKDRGILLIFCGIISILTSNILININSKKSCNNDSYKAQRR